MLKHLLISMMTVLLTLSLSGCGQENAAGDFVEFRNTKGDDLSPDSDADSQNVSTDQSDESVEPEPETGHLATPLVEATATDSDAGPEARVTDPTVVPTDSGDSIIEAVYENPESNNAETVALTEQPTEPANGLTPAQEELARMMEERAALLGGGGGGGLEVDNAAPAEPLPVKLLIAEKSFRKERGTDAVRVSYDDIDLLKILNMEPVPTDAVSHFPDWLAQLDGTRVRIRGFMFPTYEATGITRFTMARDNGICCFVRKPKIYDIIDVMLADGVESDYIEGRPFDVEGIFRIEPEADETELYRLYKIENARVLR